VKKERGEKERRSEDADDDVDGDRVVRKLHWKEAEGQGNRHQRENKKPAVADKNLDAENFS